MLQAARAEAAETASNEREPQSEGAVETAAQEGTPDFIFRSWRWPPGSFRWGDRRAVALLEEGPPEASSALALDTAKQQTAE